MTVPGEEEPKNSLALNTRTSYLLSFRAMFPILKYHLDVHVSRILGPDNLCLDLDGSDDRCLELVTEAARLAHYGYFRCKALYLNHDLSKVPGEYLCSLASIVTDTFCISAQGCDLVKIFDSVKSKELWITNLNLDREAAEAVVRAMDIRIEQIHIRYEKPRKSEGGEEDTEWRRVLTKYNGKGRCWRIEVLAGKEDKYKQWLRDWAADRDWSVTMESENLMWVERKTLP